MSLGKQWGNYGMFSVSATKNVHKTEHIKSITWPTYRFSNIDCYETSEISTSVFYEIDLSVLFDMTGVGHSQMTLNKMRCDLCNQM